MLNEHIKKAKALFPTVLEITKKDMKGVNTMFPDKCHGARAVKRVLKEAGLLKYFKVAFGLAHARVWLKISNDRSDSFDVYCNKQLHGLKAPTKVRMRTTKVYKAQRPY